jgi:hypothetical protein
MLILIGGSSTLADCSAGSAKVAYAENLCVNPGDWPRLESLMRSFGDHHNMRFYGEMEPLPHIKGAHSHDMLNFALVRGLQQIVGDDFDIWLVSDPYKANRIRLNVVGRKSLGAEEQATTELFRQAVLPLTCRGTP